MTRKLHCIEVGAVPRLEEGAEIGTRTYLRESRKQCEAFKAQILRSYPVPQGLDAGVSVQLAPHEQGSHRGVFVTYCCEAGKRWATSVSNDVEQLLQTWDADAREALGLEVTEA